MSYGIYSTCLTSDGFDPRTLLDSKPNDPAYLAKIVPPENFKNYTIASAMDASEGNSASEIHLTVGVINYEDNGKICTGTSSGFLAHSLGRTEPNFIQNRTSAPALVCQPTSARQL